MAYSKRWLVGHGYEGLVHPLGFCGCEVADLAPCLKGQAGCEPGYKVPCGSTCEAGGECLWHISTKMPTAE